ncbi:MAG TPA: hypothetical protein VNT50_07815 [Microbacterium sp.]|uniref:hypothetical protein n=1 Tax=Microbacterium sp. TaxID=51671 RepID=UPI002C39C722|nr:hypothetical protein [Microbacterium sp.]HWI31383.1 hypothetical protein [Microbacterium sp.]
MAQGNGWPRGRTHWLIGTVLLLALGALVGAVLGNIALGVVIGLIVSIGWLMAYESRRGRNVGVNDESHGIEL